MKKFLKLMILVFGIFIITGCDKNYMNEISYTKYKDMIKNNETFILEIMRTECSACISFKPKLEQVTKDYKVEVKYINTDHLTEDEYNDLFYETGISGTPTIIFYHNGAEETVSTRINGNVSIDRIISKFKINGFIED